MEKLKIAITDCDHDNNDMEKKVVTDAGFELEIFQCKTSEEVIEKCKGIPVLINQYVQITEKVFEALPELKLVVRYGVGVNNVDLVAASKHGVQVCNVPDYGMNEVADQAFAMMMALTRKVVLNNRLVREGTWDYSLSIPIFRYNVQTIGIVGIGRIGKEFAKRANSLGARIIACDPVREPIPDYVELVSFEELVKQSDIISIHCPADNNIDMFDEKVFDQMKNTAYLINVSRGGIVNEAALNDALENKKIAGAALDVAVQEPIDTNSPLLKHENFLISPHMAWYSEEAALELKRKVAEESVRFAKGEKVHYPVNKLS